MLDKINWKKQRELAQARARLTDLYRHAFSGPLGEEVLLDLMKNHGMMDSTFEEAATKAAFKEGERFVVLRILKMINTDPKKLMERIEKYERELDEQA